jgi:hypothetical protein
MLAWGTKDKEHAMSRKLDTSPTVIGIDIGKNSFHIVGQNQRGAIVLRQKWSRGQVEARLANLPPCRIGMEACVGAHQPSASHFRSTPNNGHCQTAPACLKDANNESRNFCPRRGPAPEAKIELSYTLALSRWAAMGKGQFIIAREFSQGVPDVSD